MFRTIHRSLGPRRNNYQQCNVTIGAGSEERSHITKYRYVGMGSQLRGKHGTNGSLKGVWKGDRGRDGGNEAGSGALTSVERGRA